MKCPNCGGQMHSLNYEEVIIDRCDACGGNWLDKGEIGPIVETRKEKFSHEQKIQAFKEKGMDASAEKTFSCPKCGKLMKKFNYALNSGVILDKCSDHGFWFDKGELEKIQILNDEYDREFGGAYGQEAVENLQGKMCPKCNVKLQEINYEGIKLDLCSQCGGHWCDAGELKRVIDMREKDFSSSKEEITELKDNKAVTPAQHIDELPCVICGQIPDRMPYGYGSGIVIDRCRNGHGIWLDKGEIDQIQIYAEKSKDSAPGIMKKFAKTLSNVKGKTEKKRLENSKGIVVSHFGVVNRFMQALYRNGYY